jgi:hypothetical protein
MMNWIVLMVIVVVAYSIGYSSGKSGWKSRLKNAERWMQKGIEDDRPRKSSGMCTVRHYDMFFQYVSRERCPPFSNPAYEEQIQRRRARKARLLSRIYDYRDKDN